MNGELRVSHISITYTYLVARTFVHFHGHRQDGLRRGIEVPFEAVSKTLLGLQNTLDPNIRQENEAKYKQR